MIYCAFKRFENIIQQLKHLLINVVVFHYLTLHIIDSSTFWRWKRVLLYLFSVYTFSITLESHNNSAVGSDVIFGTNMKKIKSKIMNVIDNKNILLFTRYLSNMMPTLGAISTFIIDIIIITVPNVVTEYPNCLVIVGKNP